MPDTDIDDSETLYRAVANNPGLIALDAQGNHRISSTAFNDAGRRPSVDRACLCPNGLLETRDRFRPGSGVLSLLASDIRAITTSHGSTGQIYGVDIEPVPLPENPAHAEIFGRPPFDTDKIFDRIKHALARIARIELLPESGRNREE